MKNKMIMALIIACSAALQASDFSKYKNCYQENRFFYEMYLSNEDELTNLGRLHLLSLRYLIDIRLGDRNAVYRDCNEIYDTYYGDEYLESEFLRKYSK